MLKLDIITEQPIDAHIFIESGTYIYYQLYGSAIQLFENCTLFCIGYANQQYSLLKTVLTFCIGYVNQQYSLLKTVLTCCIGYVNQQYSLSRTVLTCCIGYVNLERNAYKNEHYSTKIYRWLVSLF